MSIDNDVQNQLQAAMRERDARRVAALRMIRAALIESAKTGKSRVVSDATAIEVIRRVRKQRMEAADIYAAAGRQDLADMERAEAHIADEFLPSTADEAQTLTWVQEAIAATGADSPRQLGRVMGYLMKHHRGEVEPGVARALLERELAV